MNKFIVLTKTLLKTSGESMVQKNKNKLPKTIALFVLMAVAFLPLVASFVVMAASIYGNLAAINQQGLILDIGVLASCFVVFIFGIFYVMSTFYFSKDIESLLPLPLKPSMIIGAKFTVVLVYEYLTELVFLLPIMITFGVKSSAGFVYYLYSAVIFFALPIVPLVIAAFISMIIMRFTPFAKNKDAFSTIAGIIGITLALGFNFVFQKLGAKMENPEQMMQLMMQGNNSLVGTSSRLFPGAKLAVNSLVFSGEIKGLINMLLFLVVTIALLLLLVILGETLYFKGVIGISQSSAKRKNLSKEELEENTMQSSALKSYIIKELKLLFRTPAYFMNCVLINFLFPVIFLIPVLSQPEMMHDLTNAMMLLNGKDLPGFMAAIAFGVIMFISVANPTACTAISREGNNIGVCKFLPISYKKQIMAKILSAVLLNFIGLGLLIITAMVIIVPPVYMIVMLVILSVIATFFTSFAGILIDLSFPKLNWDNEQRAVKNNLNVLILMFLGFVIGGLTIFAIIQLNLSLWAAFAVLAVLYGVLDIVLYFIVSTLGVKMFSKIEA